MPISSYQPIRLLNTDCCYKFTTELKTVEIQISWLLKKPTDLDLHCLQRQGISGFTIKVLGQVGVLIRCLDI